MNATLLACFRGHDSAAPYDIDDILFHWTDEDWENTHDFIQWIFPTSTKSAHNPDAPILDGKTAKHLGINHWSDFYSTVDCFEAFLINTKAFHSFNHNFLRISRVIQSLQEVGCNNRARNFYNFCLKMEKQFYKGDSIDFLTHWEKAFNSPRLY